MNSYKHKKEKKQIIESIRVLEGKKDFVNNKINNTKKEIHKLTRVLKKKKQQTENEIFIDHQ